MIEPLPPWIILLEDKLQIKAEALFLKLTTRIEVLDTEVHQQKDAIKLQAVEYARRLEDLNHAHAQAREMIATYLPREIYHADLNSNRRLAEEINTWRTKIDVELAVWRGRTGISSAIAISLAVMSGVLSVWGKFS